MTRRVLRFNIEPALFGLIIFSVNFIFMIGRFALAEAALRAAAIAPAYLLGALVVAHFNRDKKNQ